VSSVLLNSSSFPPWMLELPTPLDVAVGKKMISIIAIGDDSYRSVRVF
jgi:hypothetical protein